MPKTLLDQLKKAGLRFAKQLSDVGDAKYNFVVWYDSGDGRFEFNSVPYSIIYSRPDGAPEYVWTFIIRTPIDSPWAGKTFSATGGEGVVDDLLEKLGDDEAVMYHVRYFNELEGVFTDCHGEYPSVDLDSVLTVFEDLLGKDGSWKDSGETR